MTTTKLLIVGIVLAFVIGLGVKLGQWANEQSQQTEKHFADAVRVLQDR